MHSPSVPVSTAEDRSLRVPRGQRVHTDYVSVWNVRLACRERMAVGDVGYAFQKLLQVGGDATWPCPNGYWEGEPGQSRFVIQDGRHEYLASVMLGKETILVAWVA
jgi:hypothetical protein